MSFTLCQPSAKRTAVTRLMSIARLMAEDLLSLAISATRSVRILGRARRSPEVVGSRAGAARKRPSPAPARSNGAYRFPVRRSPAGFASRVMRPIALGAISSPDLVLHPVVAEDPEHGVDPRRTPPLPAEALAAPRPHHVAPHLLLDPGLHEVEAPRRVPNPEVVHPAPQDRVDHRDDLPDRPRVPAPEHLLELPQQRRPLLHGRQLLHPPPTPRRAKPAKAEAQESERLPLSQVHDPALCLVQAHIEFRELLPQPPVHRPQQPAIPPLAVDENHQVVGIARVLNVRVPAVARDLLGPLQHRVHLMEVDVTEEG